jgi:DNA-binding PadR family transcriptional regulator
VSSRRRGELTTTSFALLGLVATRRVGWSAYELAEQMDRSLHYVWPRAQRNLYDEIKVLAERRLVKATPDQVGRRPRTLYTVTAAGRRELRRWLAQPSAPLTLESEALVRVFFADHGTIEDLHAAIRAVRDEAEAAQLRVAELVDGYDTDGGPFPERLHVIALMGKLLHTHREALRQWADWAEHEISQWHATTIASGARVPPGVFDEIIEAAASLTSRAETTH